MISRRNGLNLMLECFSNQAFHAAIDVKNGLKNDVTDFAASAAQALAETLLKCCALPKIKLTTITKGDQRHHAIMEKPCRSPECETNLGIRRSGLHFVTDRMGDFPSAALEGINHSMRIMGHAESDARSVPGLLYLFWIKGDGDLNNLSQCSINLIGLADLHVSKILTRSFNTIRKLTG